MLSNRQQHCSQWVQTCRGQRVAGMLAGTAKRMLLPGSEQQWLMTGTCFALVAGKRNMSMVSDVSCTDIPFIHSKNFFPFTGPFPYDWRHQRHNCPRVLYSNVGLQWRTYDWRHHPINVTTVRVYYAPTSAYNDEHMTEDITLSTSQLSACIILQRRPTMTNIWLKTSPYQRHNCPRVLCSNVGLQWRTYDWRHHPINVTTVRVYYAPTSAYNDEHMTEDITLSTSQLSACIMLQRRPTMTNIWLKTSPYQRHNCPRVLCSNVGLQWRTYDWRHHPINVTTVRVYYAPTSAYNDEHMTEDITLSTSQLSACIMLQRRPTMTNIWLKTSPYQRHNCPRVLCSNVGLQWRTYDWRHHPINVTTVRVYYAPTSAYNDEHMTEDITLSTSQLSACIMLQRRPTMTNIWLKTSPYQRHNCPRVLCSNVGLQWRTYDWRHHPINVTTVRVYYAPTSAYNDEHMTEDITLSTSQLSACIMLQRRPTMTNIWLKTSPYQRHNCPRVLCSNVGLQWRTYDWRHHPINVTTVRVYYAPTSAYNDEHMTEDITLSTSQLSACIMLQRRPTMTNIWLKTSPYQRHNCPRVLCSNVGLQWRTYDWRHHPINVTTVRVYYAPTSAYNDEHMTEDITLSTSQLSACIMLQRRPTMTNIWLKTSPYQRHNCPRVLYSNVGLQWRTYDWRHHPINVTTVRVYYAPTSAYNDEHMTEDITLSTSQLSACIMLQRRPTMTNIWLKTSPYQRHNCPRVLCSNVGLQWRTYDWRHHPINVTTVRVYYAPTSAYNDEHMTEDITLSTSQLSACIMLQRRPTMTNIWLKTSPYQRHNCPRVLCSNVGLQWRTYDWRHHPINVTTVRVYYAPTSAYNDEHMTEDITLSTSQLSACIMLQRRPTMTNIRLKTSPYQRHNCPRVLCSNAGLQWRTYDWRHHPINVTTVRVYYAPTSAYNDEQVVDFQNHHHEVLDQTLKKDVTIVLWDLYVKVGKKHMRRLEARWRATSQHWNQRQVAKIIEICKLKHIAFAQTRCSVTHIQESGHITPQTEDIISLTTYRFNKAPDQE